MDNWPSISDIAKKVNAKETSAVENVKEALKRIENTKEYKAVISVIKDRALERAEQIDKSIAGGKNAGVLAGVPFIAKDNFLTFGSETTAGSNILKGFNAPYQATAIEKLESEGAICVAKANLDAFAHGSSTENSDFFTTLNPHDKTRVPGGSSGGSSALVALNVVPFTLGTDTGGSIRLPANFCGVVGYKPTYGLVSRSGVIAMASSTDVIGPLTKTVADSSYILDVIAGKDILDSTTINRDEQSYNDLVVNLKGKKIGVVKEFYNPSLDEGVKSVVDESIEKLKSRGAEIVEISIPSMPLALAVYYVVVPAEISSNLMRYDGQRYGYSDKSADNLEESYEKSRSKGFGAEAKRRIMIGTYVLSSGYYDAYYQKAQTVRTKLINEFNNAFKSVDFLAGPVAPTTAFKIGQNSDDPLQMYLADIMTVGASLVGIPAISVPAGEVDNLPVGLQLMAQQGSDRELLSLALKAERK